jgi:hypothetical protein
LHGSSEKYETLLRLLTRKRQLLTSKDSLVEWCRTVGFEPAQHHRLIIDALEALARDELQKLMIFMPPGSAKSTYTSVLFVPWYLAQHHKRSVLAASHSGELAERFGRRARDLIELNPEVLGVDVSQANRAAYRWQLDGDPMQMAEYYAVGGGTPIAGFRADLGLMDDLVKSKAEVMNEDLREKLWQWYLFDYKPRLKPHAAQVLIMTRWHEDDVAGRLLQEEPGEWHLINLPMVSEGDDDPLGRPIGARLWPEWFTDQMVREAMRDPAVWLSLYQQRPTADEGTFWKRDWLMPVPPSMVPPQDVMRFYGASDYAVTKGGGDWTVHGVIGLDPQDRPWLVDLWRAQTASDVWVDVWCKLVKQWKPLEWAEERGQIISGVGPWLERESLRQKAVTAREQFVSRLDKGVRAQSMRGLIATKGLWYASDAPFRHELEAELLAFPAGKWDDQHDMLGLAGQLLDRAIHGKEKKPPDVKKVSGYKVMGTHRSAGITGVI